MYTVDPQADPYTGWDRETSPCALCGSDQPSLHFTDQTQDRPMLSGSSLFGAIMLEVILLLELK